MSREVTTLYSVPREGTSSNLHITAFAGGKDLGPCLQLTIGDRYIQVTALQVGELIDALTKWREEIGR